MTDQIWDTGTVTLTNNSTAVTGTGTGWATALVTGGILCPEASGNNLPIASVEGEEALTAAVKWKGATGTYAYAIVRETAEAVRAAWTNDRLAQIIQRLSLVGIHPDGSGTLTERDALDPTPAEGYLWLYVETGNELAFYRKTASGWDGPFAVRGVAGDDSTVPGPAGEGFTPLGAHDSMTEYSIGDLVTFGDRVFVSLVDSNTGNEPPSADEDDSYWMWIPVANGTDGRTILSGTVDPTTEGADGDFYIRTDTQYLFGPKASGTWPSGVDLNGTDGTDGRTILSGSSDPTTEGEDGDFYINTSSQTLFGPKSGTWPSGVYIGPGDDGADGAVWYTGSTDPDNGNGADGDFYLQNGTGATGVLGDVWVKASGTWSIDTNIRGASGAGTGDVVGPAGSTDGGFVKFDGTTGKQVKNSAATITAAEVSDFSTAADARITAGLGSTIQAYDADLASWAGVTRAAGFDTFAATPSSANLRSLLTDESGTGALLFAGGAFGTPSSVTLTNATGLPISTGVSGLGTNVATFLATPSSANLRAALTDETGTGIAYFVGGALGTPASATLTNATGLPAAGVTGTAATLTVENQAVTGGATITSKSLGTTSSGTRTLDVGDCAMQHYTNGGAHALAPGSVNGAAMIDITNNGSAGAITTSGFTKVAGDPFTTTNGHKFRCHVSVGNAGSLLIVQALQ